MSTSPLFDDLLEDLTSSLVLSPDLPDETMKTTLEALWHAAAGNPCSATRASQRELEELQDDQISTLRALVGRRLSGIPLMQLTGRVNFMDTELLFEPPTFLVRQETEILGNCAVDLLTNRIVEKEHPCMIDVCCGSGNLSCGIARKLPKLRVHAVDILESGVALTTRNVRNCSLMDRVSVLKGDLFEPLKQCGITRSVDLVVCNPPYISSVRLKSDRSYLLDHEPREAFDGGVYGFSMHQRLIKESPEFLKPGGWLLFEFGAGQRKQVQTLFERSKAYDLLEFVPDCQGIDRVGIGRRRPE